MPTKENKETTEVPVNIKKTFVPLLNFLKANKESIVGDLMPAILDLATAKGRTASGEPRMATSLRDLTGATVAIFDYYFKTWLLVEGEGSAEFGVKNNNKTGFNPMCKEGNSLWTKQQSAAKKAIIAILDDVANGSILPGDVKDVKADIELERKSIKPLPEDYKSFATIDAVTNFLKSKGHSFPAEEVVEDKPAVGPAK